VFWLCYGLLLYLYCRGIEKANFPLNQTEGTSETLISVLNPMTDLVGSLPADENGSTSVRDVQAYKVLARSRDHVLNRCGEMACPNRGQGRG